MIWVVAALLAALIGLVLFVWLSLAGMVEHVSHQIAGLSRQLAEHQHTYASDREVLGQMQRTVTLLHSILKPRDIY